MDVRGDIALGADQQHLGSAAVQIRVFFFVFFLSQQERWQDVSLLVWGRTGVLTPASTADTLTIPRHVLLPNHCCSDFGWLLFSHLQSSYPQSWQEDWPLSGPDCIPTVQTIQSCFPVFLGGITNSSCGQKILDKRTQKISDQQTQSANP